MIADEKQEPVVARTVKEFCRAYGVGHTKAYELIKGGEVETRKAGRHTLVIEESAQRWLRSLPTFVPTLEARTPANASEPRRKRKYQRSSKYRNLHSADIR